METNKPRIPTISSFDDLNTLLSILAKIGGVIGILVVFLYVVQIGFFPKGLTTADSLLFIFAPLALGVVLVSGTTATGFSLLWLAAPLDSLFRKQLVAAAKARRRITRPLLAPALRGNYMALLSFLSFAQFAVTFGFAYSVNAERAKELAPLLFGFIAAGFFAFVLTVIPRTVGNPKLRTSRKAYWSTRLIPLCLVPVLAMLAGSTGQVLAISMKIAGLRHEGKPIDLSVENYVRVKAAADAMAVDVSSLVKSRNSDHVLLSDSDILWHGVGDRSLLRIPSSLRKPNTAILIELDASGVWPWRAECKTPPCAIPNP